MAALILARHESRGCVASSSSEIPHIPTEASTQPRKMVITMRTNLGANFNHMLQKHDLYSTISPQRGQGDRQERRPRPAPAGHGDPVGEGVDLWRRSWVILWHIFGVVFGEEGLRFLLPLHVGSFQICQSVEIFSISLLSSSTSTTTKLAAVLVPPSGVTQHATMDHATWQRANQGSKRGKSRIAAGAKFECRAPSLLHLNV